MKYQIDWFLCTCLHETCKQTMLSAKTRPNNEMSLQRKKSYIHPFQIWRQVNVEFCWRTRWKLLIWTRLSTFIQRYFLTIVNFHKRQVLILPGYHAIDIQLYVNLWCFCTNISNTYMKILRNYIHDLMMF